MSPYPNSTTYRARSGDTSSSPAITDSPRSPASSRSRCHPRSYRSSPIAALPLSSPSGTGPSIPLVAKLEKAPPPRSEAEELLEIEEADAWFEYLDSIRNLASHEPRYAEVEPWAWARLAVRLRTIRTRRSKLKAA